MKFFSKAIVALLGATTALPSFLVQACPTVIVQTEQRLMQGQSVEVDGYVLTQQYHGNLQLYTGTPGALDCLVWESLQPGMCNIIAPESVFSSNLQGDGNFVTTQDGNPNFWTSGSNQDGTEFAIYYFVVECDNSVAIYTDLPDAPGATVIWRGGAVNQCKSFAPTTSSAPSTSQAPSTSTAPSGSPSSSETPSVSLAPSGNPSAAGCPDAVVLLESTATEPERVLEGNFKDITDSTGGNYFLAQRDNANFELWSGTSANPNCLLWETNVDVTTTNSNTVMQNDGNLVTYREPGDPVVVFSAMVTPQDFAPFFFTIDCDGLSVAIYDANPNLTGDAVLLWRSPETFNSECFVPSNFPSVSIEPSLSMEPSRSPSSAPSSSPSVSDAPSSAPTPAPSGSLAPSSGPTATGCPTAVTLLQSTATMDDRINEVTFRGVPGAELVLAQRDNANFELWTGTVEDLRCLVWETGVNETTNLSYTTMQSDGNLVTYREPGSPVVFSAGVMPRNFSSFWFVVDCDFDSVAIYDADPAENGSAERLWRSPDTFDQGCFAPSSSPSSSPSNLPTNVPSNPPSEVPSDVPSELPTPEGCGSAVILLESPDEVRVEEGDFVEIDEAYVLVQTSEGNFQVWNGPLGGELCVLWETGTNTTTNSSYTIMQNDANLVSYRIPDPIFNAGVAPQPFGDYYLVIDCVEEGDFVAIYDGNPNLNGNATRLWSDPLIAECANPPPTESPTDGKGGGDKRMRRQLREGKDYKKNTRKTKGVAY